MMTLSTKRIHTLAMIFEQYPPEAWTHVYNDGSATNVIQNGGAGIAIYFPNDSKETTPSATTRRHYIKYKAQSQRHWWKSSLLLWTQNIAVAYQTVCMTRKYLSFQSIQGDANREKTWLVKTKQDKRPFVIFNLHTYTCEKGQKRQLWIIFERSIWLKRCE